MSLRPSRTAAALVLADGSIFEGELVGHRPETGIASGEVVFNTVMTGYQEVITDPSYAGQIVSFTYPHIGNYGVNADDAESRRVFCRGVIVRDLTARPSSWRAEGDVDGYLRLHRVPAIAGIDTRRLTRHLRDAGAMNGAFGTAPETDLKQAAVAEPGTAGVDLVGEVTCEAPYRVDTTRSDGRPPWRIVAVDFGIKQAMVDQLRSLGELEVVPAGTPGSEILDRAPHGVFLSNGPGDPAMVPTARTTIEPLLGAVPVFGICLGHQLLGATLGASTFKLPFGHHGGNHPVRDLDTGEIEITSQNHNFCVADDLPGADVSHVNLNDGTVEGLRCGAIPAFSVQYHPEAGPGPHDSRYLFARFDELLRTHHGPGGGR